MRSGLVTDGGPRRGGARACRSRCPISRAGARSSVSRCARCAGRPPSTSRAAWATIPHVTQHDLADITGARRAAEAVRQAGRSGGRQPDGHGDRGEDHRDRAEGLPASSTHRSTWRPTRSSSKKYVNIGIAVDTDRGLLVPVIRDADTKNIAQISRRTVRSCRRRRGRARSRSTKCRAAASASRTWAASAGRFSRRSSTRRKWRFSASRARASSRSTTRTPASSHRGSCCRLSLSYDHRVIDGADGIRFLRWVVEAFEQPFVLALQG